MKNFIGFFIIIILAASCYEEPEYFEISGKLKKISIYSEIAKTRTDKVFLYNDFGKVAKETWYNQKGEDVGSIYYSYDSDGKLIKKENKITGQQYIEYYKYDNQGRLINISGINTQLFDLFYDEYDRLTFKKEYVTIGEKHYINITEFRYDSIAFNRISDELTYTVSGGDIEDLTLYEHLRYEYDNDGMLVQKKLVDGMEYFYRDTKEFFTYDNQGRLYKKLEYDLNAALYPGLIATSTYYYY